MFLIQERPGRNSKSEMSSFGFNFKLILILIQEHIWIKWYKNKLFCFPKHLAYDNIL